MLGKPQREQLNEMPQIPHDSEVFGTARQPMDVGILRQGVAGSNPVSPTMCPGFLTKSGAFSMGFCDAGMQPNTNPTL